MLKYSERNGRKVECGTNALNNVYVQPLKTWSDWKQMVNQLCRKPELKEKFEVIALDTIDEAWNLCVKDVCANNNVERLGDLPYGQGYDIAKTNFHQPLRDLTMNGYGLIFISHSTEKTYKNERGEEYTQIVPALPNRPFDIANKMVDIIANIREITVGEGEKSERKRFMFLRDEIGDRFLAKSRFRYIQPRIELSYDNLVNAIYEAIDKECAQSSTVATEEENPYTTLNFEELMQEAKILWSKIVERNLVKEASNILEKIFNKPTKFSEILPEDIDKLNQALLEIRLIV